MFLLLIIVVIVALAIYDDQRKKQELLNKKKIIGYDTRTGVPLYEGEKVTGYDTQTGRPIISGRQQPKKVVKPKQPIDKTKISNSILMIVGAALVVFGTVVFLTSSWDSIPNIIKPFILIFIQLVFFGSYKMCTDKLDIPKTGKVFKYLSFAFIPIVLISFSCFNLVGNSLSIGGELEDIYFMVSFIITDVIYKIYTKKNDDRIIKTTSYIIEILAILCLSSFIMLESNELDFIPMLFLSIYTIIIYSLIHMNYIDSKAYNIINLIAIAVVIILNILVTTEKVFLYYIPFILYTVFFFAMYYLKKDSEEQKVCLVLFFINYACTISYIGSLDVPRQFFYLLCTIPLLIFARLTKNASVKSIFQWLIFAFTTLNVLSIISYMDNSYYDTLSFLIATIIYVLEYLFFEKGKTAYKVGAYIAFTLLLTSLCYRLNFDELAKYTLIVVALLIYLLEKAFPSLKDSSSKHVVPLYLCLESIILAFESITKDNVYTVIIPLLLMIGYSKLEKTNEEYVFIPTLATLSLFFQEPTPLSIGVCSVLVLVYSLLSAFKGKVNVYTIVSLISILIGLPFLEASDYIVFLALGVWSITHLIANESHKDLFKLTTIASILGLYLKGMSDLDVGYISIYFLGLYMALIATTKLVFNKNSKELPILECIAFIILTLISLLIINEPVDAVIMIIVLFVITLFSFVNKYKMLLYCSLAGMIIHIIKQTLEFWTSIPIYIYILIIGLTLILFAMFDERLNKKKKDKEKTSKKDNIE